MASRFFARQRPLAGVMAALGAAAATLSVSASTSAESSRRSARDEPSNWDSNWDLCEDVCAARASKWEAKKAHGGVAEGEKMPRPSRTLILIRHGQVCTVDFGF